MEHTATNIAMKYFRLITLTLILLAGMPAVQDVEAAGITIYVRAGASGSSNGSSWTNAYTSLQSALSAASSGDQIWVAAGAYYPTTGTNRAATFTLKDGVSIYGGFTGTETLLAERNPKVNVTILSGDIGVRTNANDNSFHVVTGSGTDSSSLLDGFTITGGNAFGDYITPMGGGMYNREGNPTLSKLIFTGNKASYGGGMYNYNASPTLTDVTFINNSADRAGACITMPTAMQY